MKGELFIELLKVALGTREKFSRVPSSAEWGKLFEMAQEQAIDGVLLCGIERLPQDQWPPLDIKLQWIGEVQMIEEQNRVMSSACREVVAQFEKDGFKCCVLKGQANHRYYPEGMANRRCCGDIDIWAVPNVVKSEKGKVKSETAHPVRRTLEYVEREHELTGLCWLHCNYEDESGVPVEVHFRPSFMNEPMHNRRLQRFFKNHVIHEINELGFSVLPVEVDVVYQMNHIYRHLIDEGVGLRQIVDYYFVLRALKQKSSLISINKDDIMRIVEWLGMRKFAGALMYVLREVCGMTSEYLLCEPDEKDGRFLLNEIMTAGNFGQADPRMGELNTTSVLKRQLSQAWRRFKRNLRFVKSYPGEVIWEPVARMEHFAWKKLRLWRI